MPTTERRSRRLTGLALAMVVMVAAYGVGLPAYAMQALRDARQPAMWGGPDTTDSLERYVLDVPAIGPAYGKTGKAEARAHSARPRASRAWHRVGRTHSGDCTSAPLPTSGTGGWRNLPRLDVNAASRDEVQNSPVTCEPTKAAPARKAHRVQSSRAQALAALRQAPGVRYVQVLRAGGVFVAVEPGTEPEKLPGVRAAEEASVLPLLGAVPAPNDPAFPSAWGLHNSGYAPYQPAVAGVDTGALDAWGATMGAGAVVAVLDNGVNVAHVDLAANIWRNADQPCGVGDSDGNGFPGDCQGWNFYSHNADVTNGGGGWHGTGVAGTVAAVAGNSSGAAGLAPQATILPVVVGAGQSVYTALAIEGIYYAADNGAHVINASFGGPLYQHEIDAYDKALAYAEARGVTFVAAAGNDSGNRDTDPLYPASLKSPGKLTVGSHNADDTMSYFSGYGQGTVDLFAPGFYVVVPDVNGSYALASGTSVSAPYVAAAAALVRSQDPSLSPAQRAQLIRSTVMTGPAYEGRSVSGGRLSAGRLTGQLPMPLSYAFTGLDAVADSPLRGSVTIAGEAPTGSKSLQLTLAARYQGRMWVVPDVALTVDGQHYRTDEAGRIVAPLAGDLADSWTVAIETTLPAGEFAFVAQLLNDGAVLEVPKAAPFVVRPANVTEDGGSVDSGSGSGDAPPPASGDSTAPAPGPAPADGGSSSPDSGSGISAPSPGGSGGSGSPTGPGDGLSPGGGTAPAPGEDTGGSASQPPQDSSGSVPGTGGEPSPVSDPSLGGSSGGGDSGSATAPSAPDQGGSGQPAAPPAPGGSDGPDVGTGTNPFPGTDSFGVTAFEPYRVSTTGGDLVTVTGGNLPTNPSVTVGGTSARVVSASTTQLIFAAPPLMAGTRDVLIYAGNKSELFSEALLYVNPDAPSGGTGGAGSTSPAPGDGGAGGGGSSGGGSGGDSGAGVDSGAGPGGDSGAEALPSEVTGPGGLRLVAAPELDPMLGLWETLDCRTTCRAASF